MKIATKKSSTQSYYKSQSILFLEKLITYNIFPHQTLIMQSFQEALFWCCFLPHSRNCARRHLRFVLITEDGSTKSNYDAWLIGKSLHLLFPPLSAFREAVAHQSRTGQKGRKKKKKMNSMKKIISTASGELKGGLDCIQYDQG